MTAKAREYAGCWHYGYDGFCVTCDPASYGACEADCPYNHDCCDCDVGGCAIHDDDDDEED